MPNDALIGVVLSGGRGSRMGGLDKGLQLLDGVPLALRAAQRLQQQGLSTDRIALVANRNHDIYRSWGFAVVSDIAPDYAGPLAAMQAALHHALALRRHWVLTVPCDAPYFPIDLVRRMTAVRHDNQPVPVYAQATELDAAGNTRVRAHPVFCLLHISHLPSLERYLGAGERKLMRWIESEHGVAVHFELNGETPNAFSNLNTLETLHQQDTPTC